MTKEERYTRTHIKKIIQQQYLSDIRSHGFPEDTKLPKKDFIIKNQSHTHKEKHSTKHETMFGVARPAAEPPGNSLDKKPPGLIHNVNSAFRRYSPKRKIYTPGTLR